MSAGRTPSPAPRKPPRTSAWSKQRAGADAALIAAVRARRLLYDIRHPRYVDSSLKIETWNKIGEELQIDPAVCKGRWNNIRDNYRKSQRRNHGVQRAHRHDYKYSPMLSFLNKYFKDKDYANDTDAEDEEEETVEYSEEDNDAHDNTIKITEDKKAVGFPNIKVDNTDVDQSESLVDYEYFGKQESVSSAASFPVHPGTTHAVDAFLAGLAPTLKAMTPMHLSLAKAEMFAVVHKYEMKGIVERGCAWSQDENPLQ